MSQADEGGSQGSFVRAKRVPLRKQWFWRNFLSNIFMLGLMVFLFSPFATFLYFIGVARVPFETALNYTQTHAFLGLMLLFVDMLRVIWEVSAKRFIYAFIFDSPADWYFSPLVIEYNRSVERMGGEKFLKLRSAVDGKEISIPEYVHVEYVEISDANFSRALLLMPDTFPSTFPLHRETSPRRYPIPANVSYACLTLLLPVSYEDQYMPIYEVSYSPWFVDKRQRQMEWWEPQSAQVREALFGWERALATEYRMKLENLVAFARALMNKERDIEEYGLELASQIIELYSLTKKKPSPLQTQRKKLLMIAGIIGAMLLGTIVIGHFFFDAWGWQS